MYLFKKGDKVRIKRDHADYGNFFHQHKGSIGTILIDVTESAIKDRDDCNVHIIWNNKHHNTYRFDSLELVEESANINFENYKFNVGDTVIFKKGIEEYIVYKSQHQGNKGIIRQIYNDTDWNLQIEWEHGHKNTYRDNFVELIRPAHIEEGGMEMELPIFTGQRVCLNPESKGFEVLIGRIGDTAGYVINPLISFNALLRWKTYGVDTRKDYSLKIKFDNGQIYNVSMKDLLLVDGKAMDVEIYEVSTGDRISVYNEESRKLLDNLIIKEKYRVEKVTLWNDETRKDVANKIKNY